MPGIRFAGVRLNRAGLALLVMMAALPASAKETLASLQRLEWHGESANETLDEEIGKTESAAAEDVWQRVRDGFRIDDAASENPLVANHEAWYAARPDYMHRIVDRARRYLYHIVEEVERRDMPTEIALLPMIESAFNPVALSPSEASGIWQFIPSTGRHYGLKQDTWYDGRRDFTAATHAALDYLAKLYLDFGDWQLALAAYNCGEGCVGRAIQRNVEQGLPTDYASLSLPNETRNYVPKLLAVKNLIRDPDQYGLDIAALPNEPYFNQVTVHASLDLHSAARLAEISPQEFLALNAAFPRKVIRSDTPVNLLIPVAKADTFQRNLETGTWDSWQPYEAEKGERPEAIARRFDVSVARLKEHNQLHLRRGRLVRAQTILVPVKGRGVATAPKAAPADTAANLHKVERGDTLYGVARRYGLTLTQLAQANPNLNGTLKVGQTLLLPLREADATVVAEAPPAIRHVAFKPVPKAPAKRVAYTVKRGDTLHAIAQRFDVTIDELKRWNRAFRKSTRIHPGQQVRLAP